jgi:hypothetical protein
MQAVVSVTRATLLAIRISSVLKFPDNANYLQVQTAMPSIFLAYPGSVGNKTLMAVTALGNMPIQVCYVLIPLQNSQGNFFSRN